jgi:hypothetical protein
MRMNEAPLRFSAVARGVVQTVRRNPLALLVPAAGIGAAADLLLVSRQHLGSYLALAFAITLLFELYVGYVERLLMVSESDSQRVSISAVTRSAIPLVPALFAASVIAVSLPLAAAGLLVLPGIWLATRWSLFAPAISRERLAPLGGIRRSNELVRGRFWAVFATVTLSLLIEHAVIHATALESESVIGSRAVALIATAVAVAAVSAPAAVTISLVYDRLAERVVQSPGGN